MWATEITSIVKVEHLTEIYHQVTEGLTGHTLGERGMRTFLVPRACTSASNLSWDSPKQLIPYCRRLVTSSDELGGVCAGVGRSTPDLPKTEARHSQHPQLHPERGPRSPAHVRPRSPGLSPRGRPWPPRHVTWTVTSEEGDAIRGRRRRGTLFAFPGVPDVVAGALHSRTFRGPLQASPRRREGRRARAWLGEC